MAPALLALIPTLVEKAADLFDRKFSTDAEREQAKQEFAAAATTQMMEAWDKEQQQLTARHANDMQSDSWLSKNIRPMVLVYLMALFTLAFFMQVPEPVLNLLQNLLMTAFSFYFGLRTLEKIGTIWLGNKK
jgi:cation transport ATPase